MNRILFAFLFAPLVASTYFGLLAIVVFPFMLVVTICFELPIFYFLYRRKWLTWWHALLAGAICGASFVAFNEVLRYGSDIDRLVNANNVFFVSLGAAIGVLFWWAGIFRNEALPFVSRAFPVSFLVVVPIAALAVVARHALEENSYEGRVQAVLVEPTTVPRQGQVSVRLSTGELIEADLSDTWPTEAVVGHCVHVGERWSTLRFRRVYEVSIPFGGVVDDC